jgi:hypothetical protein
MKKLILTIALLTLSAPVFAESATPGEDRYIADFDIKTDEIKVSTSFEVADVCLLNQLALKNIAEVELRRLGFKVAGEKSVTRVLLTINGPKFSSKNSGGQNGCSTMLNVSLLKFASSRMEMIWSTGGLFTTAKHDMTEQMQDVVREHMNELYLEIMQAPD